MERNLQAEAFDKLNADIDKTNKKINEINDKIIELCDKSKKTHNLY